MGVTQAWRADRFWAAISPESKKPRARAARGAGCKTDCCSRCFCRSVQKISFHGLILLANYSFFRKIARADSCAGVFCVFLIKPFAKISKVPLSANSNNRKMSFPNCIRASKFLHDHSVFWNTGAEPALFHQWTAKPIKLFGLVYQLMNPKMLQPDFARW